MTYAKTDRNSLKLTLKEPTKDEWDEMEEIRPPRHSGFPVIWLPHSCDEWVIGGLKEAKQLLEDLTIAIAILEQDDTGTGRQDSLVAGVEMLPEAEGRAEDGLGEGSASTRLPENC